jgi:hypothetical protein
VIKLHVNQHVIRSNIHAEIKEPPLRIIRKGRSEPAFNIEILDKAGTVAGRIVYSPDKPLKCGARVWIEAHDARAA